MRDDLVLPSLSPFLCCAGPSAGSTTFSAGRSAGLTTSADEPRFGSVT
jgi:hypothetical protein